MTVDEQPSSAIEAVALDFEGVIVSNAWSLFVRQGAADFLEGVRATGVSLVIYSSAPPDALEGALRLLVSEGSVPEWYASIPRIWAADGQKDLRRIRPDWQSVLLVDDQQAGVLAEQIANWVPVSPFNAPYDPDAELERVLAEVRRRVLSAA